MIGVELVEGIYWVYLTVEKMKKLASEIFPGGEEYEKDAQGELKSAFEHFCKGRNFLTPDEKAIGKKQFESLIYGVKRNIILPYFQYTRVNEYASYYIFQMYQALKKANYYAACYFFLCVLEYARVNAIPGYRRDKNEPVFLLDIVTLEEIAYAIEKGTGNKMSNNTLEKILQNGNKVFRKQQEETRKYGPYMEWSGPSMLGQLQACLNEIEGYHLNNKDDKKEVYDFFSDMLIKEMQISYRYAMLKLDNASKKQLTFPVLPQIICESDIEVDSTNFIVCNLDDSLMCREKSTAGEYYPELGICIIDKANRSFIHALVSHDKKYRVQVKKLSIANLYDKFTVNKNGDLLDTSGKTVQNFDRRLASLFQIAKYQNKDCRTK